MKLKKLVMSSLRDATRSLLLRRSTTTCAHAVLLTIFGVACQPVDKVAIYEKNNGKQPLQAELLAKIAVGYAKLGQQDKASKLLAPAIQTAKINESIKTSESIYIRLKLLEQLGIVYVEMGQYDKALQVAKSLQVYEPTYSDIGLKHITTHLTQVGQYEKALQIAKLISIDGNRYIFENVSFLSQSTSIASQSTSIASQSTAMSEVALKYAQAGQKVQAEQILVQALQKAKTSDEMAEVALKYAQTGQKAQAEQILIQALQKANTTDEMAEIALKYAQVGQKAKALQVLAQASQNAQYPNNIDKVAFKYVQVGQQAKGEQLLAQALQSVKKEKDSKIKNLDLGYIAISYAKLGQCNQAIEIAKSIKDYPDYREFKDAYITHDGLIIGLNLPDVFVEIAEKCTAAGRYEQAFKAIQEIKFSDNKSEALGVVAVEYAKKSQYKQAFQVLKENLESDYNKALLSSESDSIKARFLLKSQSIKALALPKIVEQATQSKPSAKAEQVLSQALEVAQTIKSRDDKVKVITAIAIGYAQLKQKDKSEQLLAQALQIAENIHH
ncbi:hypothetical protein [Nostoc sp. LPT]|uniref:tetratricopeptide repeat protein n=1 Tax=Nostoc sp. LPT TaxID=2815387 RepID=UPI0025EC721C|nr:hypothetical protein [Nostoc sp. LPT]